MNTLLTETIRDVEMLINLDKVKCFTYEDKRITKVYFMDGTTTEIKEYFEDIVDMLHGD